MQIIKTKFKDLFFYKRDISYDNRGYFKELYIEKKIKKKFCFDYLSTSKKCYQRTSLLNKNHKEN